MPVKNTLEQCTISDASHLIRIGKLSPVEITQHCLDRIERFNPVLNAFITVSAEDALAQARQAEAEIQRAAWKGPLHGIPIALKDNIDVAGAPTTAASAIFQGYVPRQDAFAVRRLREAGCIFLGKLNMHECAYGGSSVISHYGPVRNPWNPRHIAGGSSSGSAAAVAAGLCLGALGTDTGGSIRQPAAFCGVAGFKPTYGRVSVSGTIPLSWSLDHVGPITRTTRDAAMMLQAIAGFDPSDIGSVSFPVPDYEATISRPVAGFRLGVVRSSFYENLDPEIASAIEECVRVLTGLTAAALDIEIPAPLDITILRAEAYAYHRKNAGERSELYHPETLRRIRAGADIGASDYMEARGELDRLRRSFMPGGGQNIFDRIDLLIAPTVRVSPPTIAELSADLVSLRNHEMATLLNTRPFNALGLPAMSVPCGFTEGGLPIGVQIVGPYFGEEAVLALAQAYESATDWHKRAPVIPERALG